MLQLFHQQNTTRRSFLSDGILPSCHVPPGNVIEMAIEGHMAYHGVPAVRNRTKDSAVETPGDSAIVQTDMRQSLPLGSTTQLEFEADNTVALNEFDAACKDIGLSNWNLMTRPEVDFDMFPWHRQTFDNETVLPAPLLNMVSNNEVDSVGADLQNGSSLIDKRNFELQIQSGPSSSVHNNKRRDGHRRVDDNMSTFLHPLKMRKVDNPQLVNFDFVNLCAMPNTEHSKENDQYRDLTGTQLLNFNIINGDNPTENVKFGNAARLADARNKQRSTFSGQQSTLNKAMHISTDTTVISDRTQHPFQRSDLCASSSRMTQLMPELVACITPIVRRPLYSDPINLTTQNVYNLAETLTYSPTESIYVSSGSMHQCSQTYEVNLLKDIEGKLI